MNADNEDEVRVGYGRPPKAHQFKKGRSGHRKGRSRGRQNLTKVASRLFDMKIPVRVGNLETKLPFLRALVQSHSANALRGDPKSLRAMSLIMDELGYFDEKPEPEKKGVLVISDLRPNEDEWFWCCQRAERRREMELRNAALEQKAAT